MKKFLGIPYHFVVLVSSCLAMMGAVGIAFNGMGLFYVPMAADLQVGMGDISVFLTISQVACGLSAPLVIRLTEKINLRYLTALGMIFFAGSFLNISFTKSLWQFYGGAVFFGTAVAMTGPIVISATVGKWFEKGAGLCIGLSFASSGAFAALMNPIWSRMMENIGWRTSSLIIGGVVVALIVPALIFVQPNPEYFGLKAYGEKAEPKQQADMPAETEKSFRVTAVFIMVCLIAFLASGMCSISTHLQNYAVSLSYTAAVGAMMMSFVMIGDCTSKFTMGFLCDKIGYHRACFIMISLSFAGFALLAFQKNSPPWVLYLASYLVGTLFSVPGVGVSCTARRLYGPRRMGRVLSLSGLPGYVGLAVFQVGFGFSFDLTGAYRLACICCLVFIFCLAAAVFVIRRRENTV